MAYEQKNNSGSLFKNDRKEKETHPDYKGSAMINGVEYWVSAWLKEGKGGTKYMSFSYQPKQEQAPKSQPKDYAEDFDDSCPF